MTAANLDVPAYHPCLVLAHADPLYQARTARSLRRLGWDVYLARTGPEARRLARLLAADLVLLGTDLPDETGWLTCDKLRRERPQVQIILVAPTVDATTRQFADFVGARAVVSIEDSLPDRIHQATSLPLPAAG